MIILAHTVTGCIIGQQIENPFLGSLASFSSHFLLDKWPHWNFEPKNLSARELAKLIPDAICSILIYIAFLAIFPERIISITLAVFFSLLPDMLTAAKFFAKGRRIFKKLYFFHGLMQHEFHGRFATSLGLLSQALYIGLLLILYNHLLT
ncbi:MAG: hypothetical protein WCV50_00655 [Patescibacteria group bacterium]|jgi:hypothetical protein